MAGARAILVILGPTASGKSQLAQRLAERVGGEILSVDSMQVYRHMDIGTAKPTAEEQRRVPHHLIDVVGPTENFTVARFVELADAAITDAAARIHRNDTKRLIRALEVHELTGQPISSLQTEWATPTERYHAVWIGLDWNREQLNRRINARVKQMMQAGWLEETKSLLDRFGELSQTAGEATGYHELIEHLRGRMSLDDAVEQIKIATRQLARRQMKWFRRFREVKWMPGDTDVEGLSIAAVDQWRL